MKKELRASVWLLIVCLLTSFQVSAEKSESEEFFVGITCPGDKWVDCDAELWTLHQFGDAYFKTYEGTFKLPEPKEHWHLNECNIGYITRSWKHKAYGKWYECEQTIHVGQSGHGSEIYWPKEGLILEGCNPNILPDNLPDYYNKPHYNSGSCDMMVDTYKDQIFSLEVAVRRSLENGLSSIGANMYQILILKKDITSITKRSRSAITKYLMRTKIQSSK